MEFSRVDTGHPFVLSHIVRHASIILGLHFNESELFGHVTK
jgi:hypothetical protein